MLVYLTRWVWLRLRAALAAMENTALSPSGDLYISDGYGNSRVHKYAPNGKLLFSWGAPGTLPGEFNIAHNICCDADGWVYVADREQGMDFRACLGGYLVAVCSGYFFEQAVGAEQSQQMCDVG